MEKVRLGIIGIGSMGTGHAGNVLKGMVPDMELTAVADIRQSRLDWARNNLPETVKVFDDGRKMIDSGSCDAVLVAMLAGVLAGPFTPGFVADTKLAPELAELDRKSVV